MKQTNDLLLSQAEYSHTAAELLRRAVIEECRFCVSEISDLNRLAITCLSDLERRLSTKEIPERAPLSLAYALAECTDPQRTVTSIMRVQNREDTMVSCKTQTTVPKDSMPEVVRLIRSTCAHAPVRIGDVLCQTPAGVSIIATKNID